jgi:hypothetical protein
VSFERYEGGILCYMGILIDELLTVIKCRALVNEKWDG